MDSLTISSMASISRFPRSHCVSPVSNLFAKRKSPHFRGFSIINIIPALASKTAEGTGFEPAVVCATTVFKTVSLSRSDTPPRRGTDWNIIARNDIKRQCYGVHPPLSPQGRGEHLRNPLFGWSIMCHFLALNAYDNPAQGRPPHHIYGSSLG